MGENDYREKQQQQFFDGETENPVFHYPLIDLAEVEKREKALTQLREEISQNETHEVVRKAYAWRLDQKIDANDLLRAVSENDPESFQALCQRLFGEPDPALFAYTNTRIQKRVELAAAEGSDMLKAAAERLRSVLPPLTTHKTDIAIPGEDAIQFVREETRKQFSHYLNEEPSGHIDAAGMQKAFEYALTTSGIDGWSIVVENTNRSGMSVNHEERFIRIPASRQIPATLLFGLTVHEVGTHIARRVGGEQSQLQLLGLGLHAASRAEEGIATVREQALSGQVSDFAGEAAYLAIGLARGLDGEKRDFRQTYEIMQAYFVFLLTDRHPALSSDEVFERARLRAWSRCVRTFRGTDCATPGVAFTKDIVYREGNIQMWNILRDRPEEIHRLNCGKYDPTNDEHIWILEQLGYTL